MRFDLARLLHGAPFRKDSVLARALRESWNPKSAAPTETALAKALSRLQREGDVGWWLSRPSSLDALASCIPGMSVASLRQALAAHEAADFRVGLGHKRVAPLDLRIEDPFDAGGEDSWYRAPRSGELVHFFAPARSGRTLAAKFHHARETADVFEGETIDAVAALYRDRSRPAVFIVDVLGAPLEDALETIRGSAGVFVLSRDKNPKQVKANRPRWRHVPWIFSADDRRRFIALLHGRTKRNSGVDLDLLSAWVSTEDHDCSRWSTPGTICWLWAKLIENPDPPSAGELHEEHFEELLRAQALRTGKDLMPGEVRTAFEAAVNRGFADPRLSWPLAMPEKTWAEWLSEGLSKPDMTLPKMMNDAGIIIHERHPGWYGTSHSPIAEHVAYKSAREALTETAPSRWGELAVSERQLYFGAALTEMGDKEFWRCAARVDKDFDPDDVGVVCSIECIIQALERRLAVDSRITEPALAARLAERQLQLLALGRDSAWHDSTLIHLDAACVSSRRTLALWLISLEAPATRSKVRHPELAWLFPTPENMRAFIAERPQRLAAGVFNPGLLRSDDPHEAEIAVRLLVAAELVMTRLDDAARQAFCTMLGEQSPIVALLRTIALARSAQPPSALDATDASLVREAAFAIGVEAYALIARSFSEEVHSRALARFLLPPLLAQPRGEHAPTAAAQLIHVLALEHGAGSVDFLPDLGAVAPGAFEQLPSAFRVRWLLFVLSDDPNRASLVPSWAADSALADAKLTATLAKKHWSASVRKRCREHWMWNYPGGFQALVDEMKEFEKRQRLLSASVGLPWPGATALRMRAAFLQAETFDLFRNWIELVPEGWAAATLEALIAEGSVNWNPLALAHAAMFAEQSIRKAGAARHAFRLLKETHVPRSERNVVERIVLARGLVLEEAPEATRAWFDARLLPKSDVLMTARLVGNGDVSAHVVESVARELFATDEVMDRHRDNPDLVVVPLELREVVTDIAAGLQGHVEHARSCVSWLEQFAKAADFRGARATWNSDGNSYVAWTGVDRRTRSVFHLARSAPRKT